MVNKLSFSLSLTIEVTISIVSPGSKVVSSSHSISMVVGSHSTVDMVKLLFSHGQPLSVRAIHHQQYELCVGVVRVPRSSQRLLAPQIPHNEVDIIPDNLLHVAANCRRRVDHLVHQKLVEDGGLAGIVKTHQTDFVFFISKKAPQFC